MAPSRKKIAILDMWAARDISQGPSKHWLYKALASEFDLHIVNPDQGVLNDLSLLVRSVSYSRSGWSRRFYRLKEGDGKTPRAFQRRTRLFQKAFDKLSFRPDLILQIGGLFGPVNSGGVPYLSYHDQTVAMVEAQCPDWLPDNFPRIREDWYNLERAFYRATMKVVTYSAATKRSMVEDYGVPDDKVVVIPTACKLPYLARETLLYPRKRQLLFVSTEFYRKGGDILLEAFPLIRKAVPDLKLVIAGGKLPAEIQLQDPAISYVGNLPAQKLLQLYQESLLLVHPARYDAFPNVVKEAVACGLPVVASASCGIPEILDQGRGGIVLQEPTSALLAAEVIALLNDEARYRQMQEHCLTLRERFEVEVVAKQFLNLLNSCLR